MMVVTRQQILSVPARSFASLMELYENNYIYIRRLVPDLHGIAPEAISRVPGGVDLYLSVQERCPYTTTLSLTHRFDGGPDASIPDLVIRVYHDARTAEVLPGTGLDRFMAWSGGRAPDERSLAYRWEINRFLNRWLRYCLGEGHHFTAADLEA